MKTPTVVPIKGALEKVQRRLAVTWGMLARSKAGKVATPFQVAKHPPGVVPERLGMAYDSEIEAVNRWASTERQYSEGLYFLGFPYLAELAQRPEYRRMSETLATEMTRKWIKLTSRSGDDKADKLRTIMNEMTRLKLQDHACKALQHDSYFGRGHWYLEFGDTDDNVEMKTPVGDGWNSVSRTKVGKDHPLLGVKVIEPVWTYPTQYNSVNPLSDDWYRPVMWFVQGRQVHRSRLLSFVGREVSDLLKPAYSFGGLSLSQLAKPYVDNWLRTRQSVSDLVHSFSVNGIKMDLSNALELDDETLFKRIQFYNNMRDNMGLMLLDKDEEFFNVSTPMGGLDGLQAQTQEHMAAVSGIPIVKLLGIQPKGLNGTDEGQLESFNTWIHSQQKSLLAPNLNTLLGFIQLSLFGEVDRDIGFEFEPLDTTSETELATIRKTKADTAIVYINAGVISKEEERSRLANDPNSGYDSIDVDLTPPVTAVEQADIATKVISAITQVAGAGLVSDAKILTELQASSSRTGLFASITPQDIADADQEPPQPEPPMPEDPSGDPGAPGGDPGPTDDPIAQDDWQESKHPRGQPGNKGQFGSGGGGSSSHDGWEHKQSFKKAMNSKAGISGSYRSELSNMLKSAPDEETKQAIKAKIVESYQAKHKQLVSKGDHEKAGSVASKLKKLGAGPAESSVKAPPDPSGVVPWDQDPAMKKLVETPTHTHAQYLAKNDKIWDTYKDGGEAGKANANAAIKAAQDYFNIPGDTGEVMHGVKLTNGMTKADVQKLIDTPATNPDDLDARFKKIWSAFNDGNGSPEYKYAGYLAIQAAKKNYKPDQKPTIEGMKAHIDKVAEAAPKPVPAPNPSFSPEEQKSFNDLAAYAGESGAKVYCNTAKQKLAKAPSIKMSIADAAHIVSYSGGGYGKVNQQLRAGVTDEGTWAHAAALNKALDQLPSYEGLTSRGTTLSKENQGLYKPGMIVEERAFTSSAKGDSQGFGGNTIFKITSKSGKYIKALSQHADENEVLFKFGSRFKVSKIDKNYGGNSIIIHMEQVH
jgi:phage-related protein (TIGR01555 family)